MTDRELIGGPHYGPWMALKASGIELVNLEYCRGGYIKHVTVWRHDRLHTLRSNSAINRFLVRIYK